jgi:predicted nucleic acid-binding protein
MRIASAEGRRAQTIARVGAGPGASSMNADRAFVDTNVLTYVFDESELEKQKRARALLQDEKREIFVSTQVLQGLFDEINRACATLTLRECVRAPILDWVERRAIR